MFGNLNRQLFGVGSCSAEAEERELVSGWTEMATKT